MVENEENKYYVREAPWQGLGEKLEHALSSERNSPSIRTGLIQKTFNYLIDLFVYTMIELVWDCVNHIDILNRPWFKDEMHLDANVMLFGFLLLVEVVPLNL